MFRKAQMKLFGIITAVLLALFIAVLGSVNIIMKMVMERQSRTVLKQIAAGVEYDDAISDFNYLPPDKSEPDDRAEGIAPPSKPDKEPGSDTTAAGASDREEETTSAVTTEVTTTIATTAENTTVTEITEPDTDEPEEDYQQEYDEPYEDDPTEPPAQEQPAATAPPAVTQPAPTNPPTNPSTTPNKDKAPEKKDDGKKDDHGGNQNDQNQYYYDPNQQYPQWPGDPNMWWWGWWGWGQQYDPNWNNWGGNGGGQQQNNNQWGWPYYQTPRPECGKDDDDKYEPYDDNDDDDDDDQSGGIVKNEENDSENNEGIRPLGNTIKSDKADSSIKQGSKKRAGAEQVPKNLGSIDFFIVMADTSGNFLASRNNDELSEDTAQKYITKILDSGSDTGTLNNFQFYRQDKDNGTLLVFTDKTAELNMLNKLYRTTIAIGIISFLALSAAAFFLSRQIIKPLKIAFEKQKQFVSDASHELKTPVTVISANADVLAGEIGENKWLTYIKSQTERMNILVNDLLHLTRLENNTSTDFIVTEFDLSKAIVNTALPFECQAFETNKNFVVQVEEGISISGSEKHIKQMAAIFIDNALKYSKDGGTVKVTLERLGDKKVFSVFNTGQGIKEEDKDKIFERFFRSDESRNRATGGYGLGLAIAKSIIDKHKFKVHVENNEGSSICFVVTM